MKLKYKIGVPALLFVIAGFLFTSIPTGIFAQEPAAADVATDTTSDEEAPEEEVSALDSGNTAWMITATALVLFMTLPGSSAVLWRSCTVQKRALCVDALLHYCLPDVYRLGSLWI